MLFTLLHSMINCKVYASGSKIEERGKRIDWVGQAHHPQPQDQIPNVRTRINQRSKNHEIIDHENNNVQAQQKQEPISIKGALDEYLQKRRL